MLFVIIESYIVVHGYEVDAKTNREAMDKFQISKMDEGDGVRYIPEMDEIDDYDFWVEAQKVEHKPKEELIAGLYNFSPVGELRAPFFSELACETCGDSLAGNRYSCTATVGKKHTDIVTSLEICESCFMYFFA